jgi:cellulose synthase/poly-beta-1,6-N-acetylglucosamine synthase-like glycosyltransferase
MIDLRMFLPSVKKLLILRQKIRNNLGNCLPEVPILTSQGSKSQKTATIAVITTCLNEETTVLKWLDRIISQSQKPDEIVICDAGSTDKTVSLISEWRRKHPKYEVKLVTLLGANIAKGRNAAAKESTAPILLFSDLGSLPVKDWVAELAQPFFSDPNAEVALGVSTSQSDSEISKAVSRLILNSPEEINPRFYLASGRSIGVTRKIFNRVGGFPEELTFAGEDTLFNFNLRKKREGEFYFCPKAIAEWSPPENLKGLIKTLFRYSRGDAESGLFYRDYLTRVTELSTILLGAGFSLITLYLFLTRYQLGVFVLLLVAVYFLLSPLFAYWKRLEGFTIKSKLLAPLTLIFAQASGFLFGLILSKKPQP